MIIFISVVWFTLSTTLFPADPIPPSLLLSITPEKAKEHLSILASDSMMGRATLRAEIWKAAQYLSTKFREYNLQPFPDTSYFHIYYLTRRFLASAPSCVISKKDTAVALASGSDFRPYYFSGEANVRDLPIVFIGYGLSLPEFNYNEYDAVDVRGKAVMLIDDVPPFIEQQIPSRRELRATASLSAKAKIAQEKGAAAVIVVDFRRSKIRLRGFPWPSLSSTIRRTALPALPKAEYLSVPVISISQKGVELLVDSVEQLLSWKKMIDSTAAPHSRLLSNRRLSLHIAFETEDIPVPNVVGYLPGALKPEEFVLVGAHFDHIGIGKPRGEEKDSIFNGADDNASGTTGLLLLAEAFGKHPTLLKRSILFVAFSGEEMGLLGSRAFVADSSLPIDRIVAMLNMDMISRNHPDTLHIGGHTTSSVLQQILEEENQLLDHPFVLLYDIEEFMNRSDQASFIRKGIPALFFFTGLHKDYHQVNDEEEWVNFQKLAHVTRLVARILWRLAIENHPIPFEL